MGSKLFQRCLNILLNEESPIQETAARLLCGYDKERRSLMTSHYREGISFELEASMCR
jgi:hypothetical protein